MFWNKSHIFCSSQNIYYTYIFTQRFLSCADLIQLRIKHQCILVYGYKPLARNTLILSLKERRGKIYVTQRKVQRMPVSAVTYFTGYRAIRTSTMSQLIMKKQSFRVTLGAIHIKNEYFGKLRIYWGKCPIIYIIYIIKNAMPYM